jgi:hypothetical protein
MTDDTENFEPTSIFIADGISPRLTSIAKLVMDLSAYFPAESRGEAECRIAALDVATFVAKLNKTLPPSAAKIEFDTTVPSSLPDKKAFSLPATERIISRIEEEVDHLQPSARYLNLLDPSHLSALKRITQSPANIRSLIKRGRFDENNSDIYQDPRSLPALYSKWEREIGKTIALNARNITNPSDRILLSEYCNQVISLGQGCPSELSDATFAKLKNMETEGLVSVRSVSHTPKGPRIELYFTEKGMGRAINLLQGFDRERKLFLPTDRDTMEANIDQHYAQQRFRIL